MSQKRERTAEIRRRYFFFFAAQLKNWLSMQVGFDLIRIVLVCASLNCATEKAGC